MNTERRVHLFAAALPLVVALTGSAAAQGPRHAAQESDGFWSFAHAERVAQRTAMPAIAVVVHPSNPLSSVRVGELRRLFLGQAQILPNKERLQIAESPAVRQAFYRSVLGMTEDRVRRHWIGVVFQGEGANPPSEFTNAEELLRFVRATPGAVAFINATQVDNSVKTLEVDGRRPSDLQYPVR